MNSVSIGDMARIFQSRQLTTGLKADMTRFGKELATGVRSDISSAVSGDFGPIASIERLLTTLTARSSVTAEAELVGASMQTALDAIQVNSRTISSSLLSMQNSESSATRDIVANDARDRFTMIVASLNTQAGGRTLFGGAATDGPALQSASDMLADLNVVIAAETTAAGIKTAVDNWFDAPLGGFETTGYLGSSNAMGSFQVGEGDTVKLDFRADNPALRDVMKGFALAALVAEGALSADANEQSELLGLAGSAMMSADQSLTAFRGQLGRQEGQIETASVRNAAQKTSLEISRNTLIAVDPFEAASKMEAAYSQLETFYTVTVRLSSLKFTDYMR